MAESSPIHNTRWASGNGQDSSVLTFLPGGVVQFAKRNSTWTATGRWELAGSQLRYDCNDFTFYEVTIYGDVMVGGWRRAEPPKHAAVPSSGATRLKRIDDSFLMADPFALTIEDLSPILRAEYRPTATLDNTVWSEGRGNSSTVSFLPGGSVVQRNHEAAGAATLTGSWILSGDELRVDWETGDVLQTVVIGARMLGERFEGGDLSSRRHAALTRLEPIDESRVARIANNADSMLINTRWTWPNNPRSAAVIFGSDGEAYQQMTTSTRDGDWVGPDVHWLKPSHGRWDIVGGRVAFDTNLWTIFVCELVGGELIGEWHRSSGPGKKVATRLEQIDPMDWTSLPFGSP